MVSYIPVDLYVTVNPSVIGAGSSDLGINGLFIGKNNLIPAGQVTEFNSADAVSDWFGSDAYETTLANVYFNGFTNCTKFPSALYFVPYITAARAAWGSRIVTERDDTCHIENNYWWPCCDYWWDRI